MLRILAVSSQDGLLMRPQCIHSEKSLFDPFRSATSTCHDFLYALLLPIQPPSPFGIAVTIG